MITNQYIETGNTRYNSGISRKYVYHRDLERRYQPAQKWLKDRRGRELSFEDILHYQKIIVSLFETDRLMKEIDLFGVE